jgi:hypothetical protein
MFAAYLKQKVSAIFAATALLWSLGSCHAANVTNPPISGRNITVPCADCVTETTPSTLVWYSTPTWTAPMLYDGSSLDSPALTLFTGDGTGAATYQMTMLDGFGLQQVNDQDIISWDLRSYLDGQGRGVNIIMRNIGGTQAAPTATTLDMLSSISMRGYGTANSPLRAAINMGAAENWSGSAQGTYISFTATTSGSTSTGEKMRLTGDGKLGIGRTAPAEALDVNGNILASGSVTAGSQLGGATLNTTGDATVGGLVKNGYILVTNSCGGAVTNCSVSCSAGTHPLGGGCNASPRNIVGTFPSGDTWQCQSDLTGSADLTAYVLCARMAN